MTRSTTLIKISINLLLIALSTGPIIYGLSLYNWDLKSITNPIYNPPIINFNSKFKSYSFEENRFIAVLEVENTGDIDVTFKNLTADLRDLNGSSIAIVYIEKPVKIIHNSYADVTLYIPLDNNTIKNLVVYYLKSKNMVFKLIGDLEVSVFSSIVHFPLKMNLQMPSKYIENYLNNIKISISSTEKIGSKIIFYGLIENPTSLTLTLENTSLALCTLDYKNLSKISLENMVKINAGAKPNITLSLEVTPEFIQALNNYYDGKEVFEMRLYGEVYLKYMGYPIVEKIDIPVTLNRSFFMGE